MVQGFEPYLPPRADLLILGSFPSVKSRAEGFYYGNPHNRFWKALAMAADRPVPTSVSEKKALLDECGVALWDVVTACEIVGSMDKDIRTPVLADLDALLRAYPVEHIVTNGKKAYKLLAKHFPHLLARTLPLPSTSPANARLRIEVWIDALRPWIHSNE